MSLKEQIQQAEDRARRTIDVPEWGVVLELISPSVEERAELIAAHQAAEDGEIDYATMYTSLLIATAHDPETGERVFGPDDAAWLAKKDAEVVNRVFEVAQEISGLAKATLEGDKKSDPDSGA